MEADDLKALCESLVLSLSLLPPHALVGLVTFGTVVQVHELGYEGCPKSYVFRGSKDYSPKQIQDMLGLTPGSRPTPNLAGAAAPGGPSAQPRAPTSGQIGATRFMLPVSQCEYQLTNILEQLQRDPWPVANDKRPQRLSLIHI